MAKIEKKVEKKTTVKIKPKNQTPKQRKRCPTCGKFL